VSSCLTLKAPAKVNFRLDVLRKRPDGYHDLRMLMQRISLYDDVAITAVATPGIRVITDSADVPADSGNIAWRAADALLRRAGCDAGLEIRISKRIPVAAGLGGGSSDAAAVLMGVNELLALGFSPEELMAIGLQLGADVPFFIFGKAAIAEGIGEQLTEVSGLPQLPLVIVNPGISVATAWVYQNLRLTTEKVAAKIPLLYESAADLCGILSNDLEAVTISRFPVISEIKERLLALGAVGALMSGSGSSVFAVFADEERAAAAAGQLARSSGWFTAAVFTI
jgi:4-diphosphocytidyl-2-C-methyl-D-erythritol kinase